ncbi:unnamed protein product [Cyclocybe aegerita]|uniref:Uncharacterized protein n=1 Tax=Cyclocybe aegerita TaxID=1973307 RepID=A0A8S0WPU4_CYCAE|nr:unnamed protein product [Cyclocybe aegerita]
MYTGKAPYMHTWRREDETDLSGQANTMDSTPGSSDVLNPLTPMAFLEPKLANQNMISTYVYVGSLSVLLWDVLSNLRKDLPLVFRLPVRLPGVVFGLSRLSALVFMFCSAIFQTAAIDIPCKRYGMIVDWLFAVVVPMTSLLFLIRIYAIFNGNRRVRTFFTVMWLAVFAGSLTPGLGLTAANIGPTKYCKQVNVESYVAAAAVIPLVNDTLVFLAISWKLMKNAHLELHPMRRTGFRVFFRGDYLPSFSRGLLQDGQVYYL